MNKSNTKNRIIAVMLVLFLVLGMLSSLIVYSLSETTSSSFESISSTTTNQTTSSTQESNKIITGFVNPLEDNKIIVPIKTAWKDLNLPKSVTVILNDSKEEKPAEWLGEENYKKDQIGSYKATLKLADGYTLEKDLTPLELIIIVEEEQTEITPFASFTSVEKTYWNSKTERQEITNATQITTDYLTNSGHRLNSGWYFVNGNLDVNETITISGNVSIILDDNSTFKVKSNADDKAGINLPPSNSLTIVRNGTASGTLTAIGGYKAAGIGGNIDQSSGDLTVMGGTINATSTEDPWSEYSSGSGIGSGYNENLSSISSVYGGTVVQYDGTINVTSAFGAGIGGGSRALGGKFVLNGGITNAQSLSGAGIGSGDLGTLLESDFPAGPLGGTVEINNGDLNATGMTGCGIGSGTFNLSLPIGLSNDFTTNLGANVIINGGFADVKQRLKKYGLFKPTYEGAVPGNPGPAPPVILLYFPARSTGQFHRRNDR